MRARLLRVFLTGPLGDASHRRDSGATTHHSMALGSSQPIVGALPDILSSQPSPSPLVVHPVVVVTVHGESDLGAVASSDHRPDLYAGLLRPLGAGKSFEGPSVVRLIRTAHLRSVAGEVP